MHHTIKSYLTKALSLIIICAMLTVPFASAANARFISPDDMDPTLPGVGTNRYAYSSNDPINKSDPNGHIFGVDDVAAAIGFGLAALGAFFSGTTPANAPGSKDTPKSISDGRQIANMATGAAAGLKAGQLAGKVVGAYAKKKDKKEEAKAASVEGQAANVEENAVTENDANRIFGDKKVVEHKLSDFLKSFSDDKIKTMGQNAQLRYHQGVCIYFAY
jgi:uncharacterized protein RhaS with RHS repeats